MKSYLRFLLAFVCPLAFIILLVATSTSCRSAQSAPVKAVAAPCALALTPQTESSDIDQEIARWQQKSRSEKADVVNTSLEQLGWKYIEKARVRYDPGFLKLAEACAACLEATQQKTTPEVLLLRGHTLHQLHRFKDAEAAARELVKQRGLSFDYGLLGDTLMEQGKLSEAIPAYQKMMDLKPNLQSYSRAAHVHWLQGDVAGAIRLSEMAAKAGSPQERDSTAWAYSRYALYQLQTGNFRDAENAIRIALELQPDHAPSLLIQGRILLAQNKNAEAIAPLKRALELNPLPEYQWTLADAYRVNGNAAEAEQITKELLAKGQKEDPRTFALYLASTKQQPELAEELARNELNERADIFTCDAVAWTLFAGGKTAEAQAAIQQALALKTQDARLFYHAGSIAAQAGNKTEARKNFQRAYLSRHSLLPSEREDLTRQMTANL